MLTFKDESCDESQKTDGFLVFNPLMDFHQSPSQSCYPHQLIDHHVYHRVAARGDIARRFKFPISGRYLEPSAMQLASWKGLRSMDAI
jgi:hypothetical protein